MTTNPTSMTILAENDTKGAAKQVLTFSFSFLFFLERFLGDLQKKGQDLNFRRKVRRNLAPSPVFSCGFIKRPAFSHKNMATLPAHYYTHVMTLKLIYRRLYHVLNATNTICLPDFSV